MGNEKEWCEMRQRQGDGRAVHPGVKSGIAAVHCDTCYGGNERQHEKVGKRRWKQPELLKRWMAVFSPALVASHEFAPLFFISCNKSSQSLSIHSL